jgi:hypothetical protein
MLNPRNTLQSAETARRFGRRCGIEIALAAYLLVSGLHPASN